MEKLSPEYSNCKNKITVKVINKIDFPERAVEVWPAAILEMPSTFASFFSLRDR